MFCQQAIIRYIKALLNNALLIYVYNNLQEILIPVLAMMYSKGPFNRNVMGWIYAYLDKAWFSASSI